MCRTFPVFVSCVRILWVIIGHSENYVVVCRRLLFTSCHVAIGEKRGKNMMKNTIHITPQKQILTVSNCIIIVFPTTFFTPNCIANGRKSVRRLPRPMLLQSRKIVCSMYQQEKLMAPWLCGVSSDVQQEAKVRIAGNRLKAKRKSINNESIMNLQWLFYWLFRHVASCQPQQKVLSMKRTDVQWLQWQQCWRK